VSVEQLTPKAFASFSLELEGSDKGSAIGEHFQRFAFYFYLRSQGCRCAPTPGLKLANAFGVSCISVPHPVSLLQNCRVRYYLRQVF
jgi:hypothetical protein